MLEQFTSVEVVLAYSVCLIIIITMIEERMGIVNLRKFHNVIVPHFCISTPVLDKNCNIYQKGMVRTILSLSIME